MSKQAPRQCAILSMDNLENFECYDHLIEAPLQTLGWHADTISWRQEGVNWDKYEAVIIRSPWDYQQDASAFIERLKEIEASGAQLDNSLAMVEWNIDKHYLAEMEREGVFIVPTEWMDHYALEQLQASFDHFSSDEIVIKPCISANADNTYRLNRAQLIQKQAELADVYANRQAMIQPFIPSVVEEGEFSLFYFNGEYSHAILKTPKTGDFRVQEEHGGQLKLIEPNQSLRQTGDFVMSTLFEMPLYARLDFVDIEGRFALMEAELIEPSLYFNMDDQAATRFAKAFNQRMQKLTK